MKLSLGHSVGATGGALLASSATLICCVLPAVLVSVGAGATVVSLVTAFPQLIWLSERKPLVFGVAGAALLIGGIVLWRARLLPCPTDPIAAKACTRLRRLSAILFTVASLSFAIGLLFAFVLPALSQ